MLRWQDLRVTTGDVEELNVSLEEALAGEIPDWAAPNFWKHTAIGDDGSIEDMAQLYICAEDEEPDWDTPRVPVDWTGFREAFERGRAAHASSL